MAPREVAVAVRDPISEWYYDQYGFLVRRWDRTTGVDWGELDAAVIRVWKAYEAFSEKIVEAVKTLADWWALYQKTPRVDHLENLRKPHPALEDAVLVSDLFKVRAAARSPP